MKCQELILKGSRLRPCNAPAQKCIGLLGLPIQRCEEHAPKNKKDKQ